MNNKQGLLGVLFLAVGLFGGWLIWGTQHSVRPGRGNHMMETGTMMANTDHQMMGGSMSMQGMMDSMAAGLQGKTGDTFDAAFLEEMIPHHQGAIVMARMVLATSKRPELVKLANDIITAQQKEIDMMRGWQKTWFGIQPE